MTWMLALAVKATLVLAAAASAAWWLSRSSASTRHAVWALALGALIALPLLSATLPELPLPLLPGMERDASLRTRPVEAPADRGAAVETGSATARWTGGELLVLTWLAGAAIGLLHLAAGTTLAAVAVRRARPLVGEGWEALLGEAAATTGVPRSVGLRVSEAVGVPIVWGYRSPTVLLPPEALEWPRGRQRAVLLHELAHVARHDCLTQTLAHVARALYWPHPLVWRAVAALRHEAERACDDRVLAAGTAAPAYARHLLGAARDLARPAGRFLTAPAGAERTGLGARVVAILDESLDRRRPGRGASATLGASALLAVGVLAAAEPVTAPSGVAREQATAGRGDWIRHQPFGCLVGGRFAEIDATIEPASEVAEARLYFSSALSEADVEYWVEMTSDGSHFVGRLPKPRVVASPISYRIEARGSDGRTATTERHQAVVAADEGGCPGGSRIAPQAPSAEPVSVHGSPPRPE